MIPLGFGVLNIFAISKTLNKPILLFLLSLFIVLIFLGVGRAIYLKGTSVSETYMIKEEYSEIKIEGINFDVNIYLSSNGENKVVYMENSTMLVDVNVVDNVLVINQKDNRKFYDRLFDFNDLKLNIYLSNKDVSKLKIDSKTSDIEINKGFSFYEVNINNSTGDIEFESDVIKSLNISNSTGDIEINNSNIEGVVNLKTSTGGIELEKVKCGELNIKVNTGNSELDDVLVVNQFKLEGSTGNLKFNDFDAGSIYVNLSTGNVKGILLSNKIFIVKTSTGNIQVPETLDGGVCKITTSTGNVRIVIK